MRILVTFTLYCKILRIVRMRRGVTKIYTHTSYAVGVIAVTPGHDHPGVFR